MGGTGKGVPRERQRRDWLFNVCITALAAGAVVALGHWFNSTQGRRLGGAKKRPPRAVENVEDEDSGIDSQTNSKRTQPKSLAELRLLRLKAAEARLHSARNEPSAACLTPLGRVLKLAERVDKLEEETQLLLEKVSVARAMTSLEEKEQERLLELLTLLQIEMDGLPGDESVRPHRRSQTNRIQTLIVNLDELRHRKVLAETVVTEVGSNQALSEVQLSICSILK